MNVTRRLVLRMSGRAGVVYALVARVFALVLRARLGGTVFASGGLGRGEVLPGISDVDLVVVTRSTRPAPSLGPLVHGSVHDPDALVSALRDTALTYGLSTGEAVRPHDAGSGTRSLLEGPGLYGPMDGWKRLAGPPLHLGFAERERQHDRIAAWMTLQSWWRHAYRVCAAPESPWAAYLCVKLVAEPARAWLWLARGERAGSRADALRRASIAMPEEAKTFAAALRLYDRLRFAPPPPLDFALAAAARLTDRVGRLVSEEACSDGVTEVELVGSGLPHTDWFALAYHWQPDEPLLRAEGPPTAQHLAVCASREHQTAVPYGEIFLLPVVDPAWRGRLRAVQCAASDPVTTALLAGRSVARFPDVAGWSARDWARRAVNEHRPYLREDDRSVARALSFARAALFGESIAAGAPRLGLTLVDTGDLLAERLPGSRDAVDAAVAAHASYLRDGTRSDPAVAAAITAVVRSLPDFAR